MILDLSSMCNEGYKYIVIIYLILRSLFTIAIDIIVGKEVLNKLGLI